jgi:hypothetical protein
VTMHDALLKIRNQRVMIIAETSGLAGVGAGALKSMASGPLSENVLYGAGAGVGTLVALTGLAAACGWLTTPPNDSAPNTGTSS